PEQLLLLKAIAVLNAIATLIGGTYLRQRQPLGAWPDEPTDTRLALGFAGVGTQARHAQHTQVHLAGLFEMQMVPALHQQRMPTGIAAFPVLIGLPMRALIVASKALAIFARCPPFAGGGRGGSI